LITEAQATEGIGRDPTSQMARAAAADPDYGERIACSVSDRTARAWALTSVAKTLLDTDQTRAARLLTDAADIQAGLSWRATPTPARTAPVPLRSQFSALRGLQAATIASNTGRNAAGSSPGGPVGAAAARRRRAQ
jgi:hypothetical protein